MFELQWFRTGSRNLPIWWRTWLSPIADVTIAAPSPVVTLTLIPPIMLHTPMYHNMLFFPYLCLMWMRAATHLINGLLRSKIENNNKWCGYKYTDVHQKPWGEEKFLEFRDLADGRFLGPWSHNKNHAFSKGVETRVHILPLSAIMVDPI